MISPTDLFHPSPAPHFKTFQMFLIYCPKRPSSDYFPLKPYILLSSVFCPSMQDGKHHTYTKQAEMSLNLQVFRYETGR